MAKPSCHILNLFAGGPSRLRVLALAVILPAAALATSQPLDLNNRQIPVAPPAREIWFTHPTARSVAIRHDKSDWAHDHFLRREENIWRISIHELGWTEGHHEFKFRIDDQWEEGPNRYAYISREGILETPPALYLTWQRDPTTTITVHWHTADRDEPSRILYQAEGESDWLTAQGTAVPFPDTPLFIHTVELTGLEPDSRYRFRRTDHETTYRFATLPQTIDRPLRIMEGGIDINGLLLDEFVQPVMKDQLKSHNNVNLAKDK